jgi:uncharacterized protein (DUF1501 family)
MSSMTINRRRFLARSLSATVGATTLYASLGSLRLMQAMAAAPAADYRALVCVFLYGGNDSFNMLVPAGASAWAQYAESRRNLAIAHEQLLPLAAGTGEFGLHPAMGAAQRLFDDGRLAFVANVGALVEPVSKDGWEAQSAALPPRLFSHNDQQAFVQRLGGAGAATSGWAGRMADLLLDAAAPLAMNVSLAGSNQWQIGGATMPFSLSPAGVQGIPYIDAASAKPLVSARSAVFEGLLADPGAHLFAQEFAAVQRRAMDTAAFVGEALAGQAPLATAFPASGLGASLAMVARMIQARRALGLDRQVFFVALGGWDTHGDQLAQHAALLTELSEGLAAFDAATSELGVDAQVTTFTASDFGRTLTSNGDGSDHGWGGNQIVMGGALRGGTIVGDYPELLIGGEADAGRGRMIPGTAMDTLAATLARWYGGFGESTIHELLPNLRNFGTPDLGLFA